MRDVGLSNLSTAPSIAFCMNSSRMSFSSPFGAIILLTSLLISLPLIFRARSPVDDGSACLKPAKSTSPLHMLGSQLGNGVVFLLLCSSGMHWAQLARGVLSRNSRGTARETRGSLRTERCTCCLRPNASKAVRPGEQNAISEEGGLVLMSTQFLFVEVALMLLDSNASATTGATTRDAEIRLNSLPLSAVLHILTVCVNMDVLLVMFLRATRVLHKLCLFLRKMLDCSKMGSRTFFFSSLSEGPYK